MDFLSFPEVSSIVATLLCMVVGALVVRFRDALRNGWSRFIYVYSIKKRTGTRVLPSPDKKYTGKAVFLFEDISSINISLEQKIWLLRVYELFLRGEAVAGHVMKREIYLPESFKYEDIDKRLLDIKNNQLTILGLYVVNPCDPVFEKLDVIFSYIKKLISENSRIETLFVKDLSKRMNISERDVSVALNLAATGRGFSWMCCSRGGNKMRKHYIGTIVTLGLNCDKCVDFYSGYHDFAELLNRSL